MMLQRNLLYTAVTRAKRLVVLVGSKRAVGQAVLYVRADDGIGRRDLFDAFPPVLTGFSEPEQSSVDPADTPVVESEVVEPVTVDETTIDFVAEEAAQVLSTVPANSW